MPLSKIKIAGNAYDAWATKPDVEEAKKKIMGADSTNVDVIGTDVFSFGAWTKGGDLELRDIFYEDGKYWLGALSSVYEEADIYPGKVLKVDDTMGESYMLIKSVDPTVLSHGVNAAKDENDNYYLVNDYVVEAMPVEPGKNYVCTGTAILQDGWTSLRPLPLDTATIRGTLYLWAEYDGDSIHDAKKEILNAIDTIDVDTSDLAKQGTDPDVSLTGVDGKLGDVEDALEYIEGGGLPTITAIAKQGTNSSATLTATQAAVVDGNDTAISVSKEIRSEVGTGSDTAAETGTLFAVLKWVKDKVKSIFNLIGSPATGQPSTLFAAIAAGGGGGTPVVVVANTTASQELAPNTLYIFESRTNNLTLTLGSGTQGQESEYHFFLLIGATAPTITFPNGITWVAGAAPTISASTNYEFDILEGVTLYCDY